MKTSGYILYLSFMVSILLPQYSYADENQDSQNKLFQALDKNNDGKVTNDEVSKDQNKFFDRLLRIGDQDDNGELTQEEFTKAMNRKEAPVISEKGMLKGQYRGKKGKGKNKKRDPEIMFKRLDKNKDGVLTEDEVNKKGKGAKMINRLYKALDKEPGDEISKEEFMEIAQTFGKNRGNKNKGFGKFDGQGQFNKGPKGKQGDRMDFMERGGRHHIPKFFELLDTNNDHELSKEELSKAGDLMAELDEDDDGSLSPREILGPPPERFADKGFGKKGFGNKDGKGNKGRNKFKNRGPGNKKSGGKGFGKQSGRRKGLGGGNQADMLLKQFDNNNDGKLVLDELPGKFRNKFDQVDSDGDGFVTRDELNNSFRKQGKKRRKK